MKKLISLLFVALISSQMWGATAYYAKIKSADSSQGTVSWKSSTGWTTETTTESVSGTTGAFNFYVKPASGYQFDYAIRSSASTTKWYILNSSWNTKPMWDGSSYYTCSIKQSNMGGTKNTSTTAAYTITVYFKPVYTLIFKNEDGSVAYQNTYRDKCTGTSQYPTGPSTITDLPKPTKADDANYTYTFDGWYNGSTKYASSSQVSASATYTARFTATPKVSYVTATFNNYDGKELAKYTNVVSGTQPTYSGSTPTKPSTAQYEYTFNGWNDGTKTYGLEDELDKITSNTTYTAQFTESTRQYTIRFLNDDGTTVIATRTCNYGTTAITEPAPEDFTKINPAEGYSYNFVGWDANNDGIADGVITPVTGDQDYVAVFNQVANAPKYNLTVSAFTNGSVTLTAGGNTVAVPTAGGTYQYEQGTVIKVDAIPVKGYHFNKWTDNNSTVANRQIDEIAANTTIAPTFAVNTAFDMYDTWEESTFKTNCAAATGYLDVTLVGRTFTANQWATLSVPFKAPLDQDDELYNAVYKFNYMTLSQDGGSVTFEFIRTNKIEANVPYLVVPRKNISEVIFYGVKMSETIAEEFRTTDDRVKFVSSLWQQTIYGPNDFYVAVGNSLRYASTLGSTVKGNRAFFRKIGDAATAPRRVVIRVDGEEKEVVIAEDGIEEVQNVRKRMENGVLIIERNGVNYDAQGKRVE